jgi:hypothetical protein
MRFPLRVDGKADERLWARFTTWCADNRLSINSALLLLVRAAVEGRVSITASEQSVGGQV